jgi:hypothetical protein
VYDVVLGVLHKSDRIFCTVTTTTVGKEYARIGYVLNLVAYPIFCVAFVSTP